MEFINIEHLQLAEKLKHSNIQSHLKISPPEPNAGSQKGNQTEKYKNIIKDKISKLFQKHPDISFFTVIKNKLKASSEGLTYILKITTDMLKIKKSNGSQAKLSEYKISNGELRTQGKLMSPQFLESFVKDLNTASRDIHQGLAMVYEKKEIRK
ncbi:hypothetical protein ACFLZV_03995 [Candidatus Margulisiibacteriota bacterium]